MFPVEAFERTIAKFVAIADSIGLPFHLTGGSISSAYGEPRLTQDVDIVVSPVVVKKRLADLIARLQCKQKASSRIPTARWLTFQRGFRESGAFVT